MEHAQDEFDHERLYQALSKIKVYWILCYNDSPHVRKKYKQYHIKKIPVSYALYSKKDKGSSSKKNELIITNYK